MSDIWRFKGEERRCGLSEGREVDPPAAEDEDEEEEEDEVVDKRRR